MESVKRCKLCGFAAVPYRTHGKSGRWEVCCTNPNCDYNYHTLDTQFNNYKSAVNFWNRYRGRD